MSKFAFRPPVPTREDEGAELRGHQLFMMGRSRQEVARFAALSPRTHDKILEGYLKAEAVRKEPTNAPPRKAD